VTSQETPGGSKSRGKSRRKEFPVPRVKKRKDGDEKRGEDFHHRENRGTRVAWNQWKSKFNGPETEKRLDSRSGQTRGRSGDKTKRKERK